MLRLTRDMLIDDAQQWRRRGINTFMSEIVASVKVPPSFAPSLMYRRDVCISVLSS